MDPSASVSGFGFQHPNIQGRRTTFGAFETMSDEGVVPHGLVSIYYQKVIVLANWTSGTEDELISQIPAAKLPPISRLFCSFAKSNKYQLPYRLNIHEREASREAATHFFKWLDQTTLPSTTTDEAMIQVQWPPDWTIVQKIELLKVTRFLQIQHPIRDKALYSEMFMFVRNTARSINPATRIEIYKNAGVKDDKLRNAIVRRCVQHVEKVIWAAGDDAEYHLWLNAFAYDADMQAAYSAEYDKMVLKMLKMAKQENAQLRARERRDAKDAAKDVRAAGRELHMSPETFIADALDRRGVSTIQRNF